jgi:hypothetical protein
LAIILSLDSLVGPAVLVDFDAAERRSNSSANHIRSGMVSSPWPTQNFIGEENERCGADERLIARVGYECTSPRRASAQPPTTTEYKRAPLMPQIVVGVTHRVNTEIAWSD